MDSDWAGLPQHLLDLVVDRLVAQLDFARFSIMCMSWHSVAKHNQSHRAKLLGRDQPPMLMVSTDQEGTWNLCNLMDEKVLDLQVNSSNKRFCGSSKGWVIIGEENFAVTLLDPLSRTKGKEEKENSIIRLPPLITPPDDKGGALKFWTKNYEYYVHKATLTADPILNANECVVVVIFGHYSNMAFLRLSKDTTWTYVDEVTGIREVVCIENKFYVVDVWSRIFTFDITTQSYSDIKFVAQGIKRTPFMLQYLVALNDKEVLMVHRLSELDEDDMYVTKQVKIFELNFDEHKWIEKKTLGDIAIFVGDNSSLAVPASNFPGYQPNFIYFNHFNDRAFNNRELQYGVDFGAYDVENQCFLAPYSTLTKTMIKMAQCPPIWVVPTFRLI
ncbi:unnamed protein product [Prunus armeniaca]